MQDEYEWVSVVQNSVNGPSVWRLDKKEERINQIISEEVHSQEYKKINWRRLYARLLQVTGDRIAALDEIVPYAREICDNRQEHKKTMDQLEVLGGVTRTRIAQGRYSDCSFRFGRKIEERYGGAHLRAVVGVDFSLRKIEPEYVVHVRNRGCANLVRREALLEVAQIVKVEKTRFKRSSWDNSLWYKECHYHVSENYCKYCAGSSVDNSKAKLVADLSELHGSASAFVLDGVAYRLSDMGVGYCEACDSFKSFIDLNGEISNHTEGEYTSYPEPICDECYESGYEWCDSGEHLVSLTDYEDGDYGSCYDCTRNDRDSDEYLYDYHDYRIEFEKLGGAAKYWIGIELETDMYCPSNKDTGVREFPWACRDGSLERGAEYPSNPMTVQYLKEHKSDIEKFCNELVDKGARADKTSTCGQHIHISRTALGKDEKSQYLTLEKMNLMLGNWQDELFGELDFTRRHGNKSWCYMPAEKQQYESNEEYVKEMRRKCKEYQHSQALNNEHDNTIEMRIMKGTLNINTMYANWQFLDELVRQAKHISFKEIDNLTFSKFIERSKYEELKSYYKIRVQNMLDKQERKQLNEESEQ